MIREHRIFFFGNIRVIREHVRVIREHTQKEREREGRRGGERERALRSVYGRGIQKSGADGSCCFCQLKKACENGDAGVLRTCLRSNPGLDIDTLEDEVRQTEMAIQRQRDRETERNTETERQRATCEDEVY